MSGRMVRRALRRPNVPLSVLASRRLNEILERDPAGERKMGRTTISCRKSETRLSLPHEQSCASACQDCGLPFRRISRHGKGREKKSCG